MSPLLAFTETEIRTTLIFVIIQKIFESAICFGVITC